MKKIETKAGFFRALGDPVRLKIILHLLEKEECTCICNLSSATGRDQSVVFRHVQLLKDAGIISTGKDGKFLMCCIKDKKMIRRYLEGP